jgi:type II secretory pathway pseudopilin PulG
MTLLESLVALVVLGLSAVGFLDLFQAVSARTAATAGRAQVLAIAESTMERVLVDAAAPVGTPVVALPDSAGVQRRIEVRPHATGLREIVVTVETATGGRMALHRLADR